MDHDWIRHFSRYQLNNLKLYAQETAVRITFSFSLQRPNYEWCILMHIFHVIIGMVTISKIYWKYLIKLIDIWLTFAMQSKYFIQSLHLDVWRYKRGKYRDKFFSNELKILSPTASLINCKINFQRTWHSCRHTDYNRFDRLKNRNSIFRYLYWGIPHSIRVNVFIVDSINFHKNKNSCRNAKYTPITYFECLYIKISFEPAQILCIPSMVLKC